MIFNEHNYFQQKNIVSKKQQIIESQSGCLIQSRIEQIDQKGKDDQKSQESCQQKFKPKKKDKIFQESPYLQKYLQYFPGYQFTVNLSTFSQSFIKEDIIYRSQIQQGCEFQCKKVFQSRNMKIVVFQVVFSYFHFTVNLLNLVHSDQLYLSFQKFISQGTYGKVYCTEIDGKSVAIKQIPYIKQEYKTIKNAIKEYSLMKICSTLKISPYMPKIFGFDMVATDSAVYFSMQKGIQFFAYQNSLNNKAIFQQKIDQMKKSLILMHKINITHNDIKPQNIVFSPQYNTLAFIDFGLSQSNRQSLGLMKMQSGKGSLHFCCDQMEKVLLGGSRQALIDMYYNDLYAFEITIKQCVHNEYKQANEAYFIEPRKSSLDFISQNASKQGFLSRQQEDLSLIRFIFQISFQKYQNLIVEIENQQNKMELLRRYFGKIIFVFFELELNYDLLYIFNKIIQIIEKQQQKFTIQTQQILQNCIFPYFNLLTGDKKSKFYPPIIENFLKTHEQRNMKIRKRYYRYQQFQKFKQKTKNNLGNRKIAQIQQFQIDIPNNFSMQMIQKQSQRLAAYFMNKIPDQIFSQIVDSITCTFQYEARFEQFIIEKNYFFKKIFKKANISLKFIYLKQNNNQTDLNYQFQCMFKLIYLIFLKILQKYKLTQTMINFILKEQLDTVNQSDNSLNSQQNQSKYRKNQKISKDQILKMYKSILKAEQTSWQSLQNKAQIGIQSELIIQNNFFKSQHKEENIQDSSIDYRTINSQIFKESDRYRILFHQILSVLNKLNNVVYQMHENDPQINLNQIYLNSLFKIIKKCISIKMACISQTQIQLSQKQPLEYYIQMILIKCTQLRLKFLIFAISKAQQTFNIYDLVKNYTRIFYYPILISQQMKLNFIKKGFQSTSNYLNEIFEWNHTVYTKIFLQSQQNFDINRNFFQMIIISLLIPQQSYKDFKIAQKYVNLLQSIQINCNKMRQRRRMSMYFVSKLFNISLQQKQMQKILAYLKMFEVQKTFVNQQKFNSLCLSFFEKIHHSRHIRKYQLNNEQQTIQTPTIFKKNSLKPKQFDQIVTLNNKNAKILKQEVQINTTQKYKQFNSIQMQMAQIQAYYSQLWISAKEHVKKQGLFAIFPDKLAFTLSQIFYSQNDWLFDDYMNLFQIEIEKIQRIIQNMIFFFTQNRIFRHRIPLLFGYTKETYVTFWQRIKHLYFIGLRIKIVKQILKVCQTHVKVTKKSNKLFIILQQQWKKLNKVWITKKTQQNGSQLLFQYLKLQLKTKYFIEKAGIVCNEGVKNDNYQKTVKKFLFFVRLEFEKQKISKEDYESRIEFVFKKNILQILIRILIDANNKTLSVQMFDINFFQIKNKSKISQVKDSKQGSLQISKNKNQNNQGLRVNYFQKFLKQLFRKLISSNQTHRIFYLSSQMNEWLYALIDIGLRQQMQAFEGIQIFDKYKNGQKQNKDIVFEVFSGLGKFISEQKCSSYSNIYLHYLKYFKNRLKSSIAQSKINHQISVRFIQYCQSNFKIYVQKIVFQQKQSIIQQQISKKNDIKSQFYLFLLQLIKIKSQIIIQYWNQIQMKQKIDKIYLSVNNSLIIIVSHASKLQFIMKLHLLNSYYFIMSEIYKNQKIQNNIIDLNYSSLKVKNINYYNVKLGRSCRKLKKFVNDSKKQIYSSFDQIDYFENLNSFSQKFIKKLFLDSFQNNKNTDINYKFSKKVQAYISNIK